MMRYFGMGFPDFYLIRIRRSINLSYKLVLEKHVFETEGRSTSETCAPKGDLLFA